MLTSNLQTIPSMLTDDQWSLIQPLLPPPSPYLRGRPPLDDRRILEAILYKVAYHLPWYDLPPEFPSHQTVYRRYRQWLRLGHWEVITKTLFTDLAERGGMDLKRAFAARIYRFQQRPTRWTVELNPLAPAAWQNITGLFFVQLIVRDAYDVYHSPSSASPDFTAYLP